MMKEIWERIEAWFRSHAPQELEQFRPPVRNRPINHLEDTTELHIPQAMEDSYKIHDGSWGLRMFPEGSLMGIEAIEAEWLQWLEVVEANELPECDSPPAGVQPIHWSKRWLPVTDDGSGNHYCVDLDPADGGTLGQIIWFHHEDGPIRVVADGFENWLDQYATDLEAGRYAFEEPSGIVEASSQ